MNLKKILMLSALSLCLCSFLAGCGSKAVPAQGTVFPPMEVNTLLRDDPFSPGDFPGNIQPVTTQAPVTTTTRALTTTTTQTPVTTTAPYVPEIKRITLCAAGDCTLGTDASFNQATSLPGVFESSGDPRYLFKNVETYFQNADYTIVNLETTFTLSDQRIKKKGKPTFFFKGDPELANSLVLAGVDAVNIANNHIGDYGEQGYWDTVGTLDALGIGHFDYGNIHYAQIQGVNFAFLGYTGWGANWWELAENIARLKDEGYIVVVNFHWGEQNVYAPDASQIDLARYTIDQGADLIIGHHPHVLQGAEKYNGKYIFYSLGNFCYGGHSNPDDKDSAIIQMGFTFADDVLEGITPRIIPCKISSVPDWNDYCPTPATGDEGQRIIDKISGYSINGLTFDTEGLDSNP